jgi:hypothetical protein
MMRAPARGLCLLLLSALLACGTDEPGEGSGADDGSGDGSGGDGSGGPVVDGADLAGDISASATFTGTVRLTGNATVLPGVDIALAPGSELIAAAGSALTVRGSLSIEGAADSTVSILPEEGADGWVGIAVESGGRATIRHATGTKVATLIDCRAGATTCALEDIDFENVGKIVTAASTATLARARVVGMANGAVSVQTGGDLTVSDSELMTSTHDLVVATGGSLLVEYSNIGGTVDTYEHCNLHIGQADSLTIRYSNIVTAAFGMMIGGVDGAAVNYNNFQGNDPGRDIDPVGVVTNGDFRDNYWEQGAPAGLGEEYDFSSPASAPIPEAGPRN